MTKVMLTKQPDGTIFFDCLNHCKDRDVCTIISTLCNVIVHAAMKCGVEPTVYEPGHVNVVVDFPPLTLEETIHTVMDLIEVVRDDHPDLIKIY